MGGREVTPEEAPQLHAIVDRLCALADMPKPKVAIADTDVPERVRHRPQRRSSAVVCATTGLMRRLDERELEGVLAHELSHVAHRDVTVMTIASFLGVLAGLPDPDGALQRHVRRPPRQQRQRRRRRSCLIITLVSVVVYALSLPAHPHPVPLPRAGRRPGRRLPHRAAVRAGLGADQDQRRDGPDPHQGPAPGRAVQRVLLRPRDRPGLQHLLAVLHPPAAGAAARPARRRSPHSSAVAA